MTVKVLIIILSSIKSIVPKLTLLPPKYLINGKKIAKLVNVVIYFLSLKIKMNSESFPQIVL